MQVTSSVLLLLGAQMEEAALDFNTLGSTRWMRPFTVDRGIADHALDLMNPHELTKIVLLVQRFQRQQRASRVEGAGNRRGFRRPQAGVRLACH